MTPRTAEPTSQTARADRHRGGLKVAGADDGRRPALEGWHAWKPPADLGAGGDAASKVDGDVLMERQRRRGELHRRRTARPSVDPGRGVTLTLRATGFEAIRPSKPAAARSAAAMGQTRTAASVVR